MKNRNYTKYDFRSNGIKTEFSNRKTAENP